MHRIGRRLFTARRMYSGNGIAGVILFCLVVISDCSTVPTELPNSANIVYNPTLVQWSTAGERCLNQSARLPVFGNASVDYIGRLKRHIHLTSGSDVWTGDYRTFEVVAPTTNRPVSVSGLQCVSAILTGLQAQTNSMRYSFNLTLTNCSDKNKYICKCHTGGNKSTIRVHTGYSADRRGANASCRGRGTQCSLWAPELSLYNIAQSSSIGLGTILLGDKNTALQLLDKFWTSIRIKDSHESCQVSGANILECGYITYRSPRLLYRPCNQRKGFVCEIDSGKTASGMLNRTVTPAKNTESGSLTGGALAGIVLGILFVAGLVTTALLVWRKRNNQKSDSLVRPHTIDSRPQGGRSFKPSPSKEAAQYPKSSPQPNPKRMTTYAQIHPDDLDGVKAGSGHIPPYTSIQFSNPISTPDIVQTTTEYLPMGGHMTNLDMTSENQDSAYDSLCHSIRESTETFEQSTNVYGTASGEVETSTYSSTIRREDSNHRRLDDYDHVTVSKQGTMQNRACNSGDMDNNNMTDMSTHNPVYETMEVCTHNT